MRWVLGLFLIAACQNSPRKRAAPPKPTVNLMTPITKFYTALRNKQFQVASTYIDPQWGVHVIDCRSGALPVVDTLHGWEGIYTAIASHSPLPKLTQKKLPQISCESPTLYTAIGTFVDETYDGYLKSLTSLPDLSSPIKRWLSEKDKEVRLTVLDTYSHMWYYWALRGKNWRLVAVRICPPCGG